MTEIYCFERSGKSYIIRGEEAATRAFYDLAGRRDDGPAAEVGAVAGALVIVCGNARLPCREGFPVPGAGAVRCRAGKVRCRAGKVRCRAGKVRCRAGKVRCRAGAVPCGDGKPFWWDGLLFWFYLFIY
uniref:Uncharacterized protein n=1 Tax=Candidatus Kentrum sp. DK TaxID=2126562 RepID=A0A450S4R1_9GAMM|nr:MAG: hypothetical protein BECKDK2373B_GA0170837_101441 [Candidatus Kentron sp. DK]